MTAFQHEHYQTGLLHLMKWVPLQCIMANTHLSWKLEIFCLTEYSSMIQSFVIREQNQSPTNIWLNINKAAPTLSDTNLDRCTVRDSYQRLIVTVRYHVSGVGIYFNSTKTYSEMSDLGSSKGAMTMDVKIYNYLNRWEETHQYDVFEPAAT